MHARLYDSLQPGGRTILRTIPALTCRPLVPPPRGAKHGTRPPQRHLEPIAPPGAVSVWRPQPRHLGALAAGGYGASPSIWGAAHTARVPCWAVSKGGLMPPGLRGPARRTYSTPWHGRLAILDGTILATACHAWCMLRLHLCACANKPSPHAQPLPCCGRAPRAQQTGMLCCPVCAPCSRQQPCHNAYAVCDALPSPGHDAVAHSPMDSGAHAQCLACRLHHIMIQIMLWAPPAQRPSLKSL